MSPSLLNRLLVDISYNLPDIAGFKAAQSGRVVGKYFGAYVSSVFQPWRRASDRGIAAFEAYARLQSKVGEGLSPWRLFADTVVDHELVTLDRLCRTVHALNYFGCAKPGGEHVDNPLPLVLNVDARLLQAVPERHGEFFGKVLSLLEVAPQKIIIEIHTNHLLDLSRMRHVLASYRRHGFSVAVNAEGMLHARSLAELLAPDYLLLDASVFSPNGLARHAASLSRSGICVGVKRIETVAQWDAVRQAGVEWVQGYYFDQPAADNCSVSRLIPQAQPYAQPQLIAA